MLALTPSDYAMFDGSGAGVYTQVLPTGNNAVNIVNAVGLGAKRKEVATAGGYVFVIEQIWWLPVAQLGNIVPAEGDFFTDRAGINWWLQADIDYTAAGIAGVGAMYRVVTRQQRSTSTSSPSTGGASGTFGS